MFTKTMTSLLAATAALAGIAMAAPTAMTTIPNDNNIPTAITARTGEAASTSGRFTYYNPGLGACGYTNTDSDYVVALSHADFDPSTPNGNPNENPLCGKKLRAAYNGKTVDVTVVDRCVACNSGDLDLSPAAFSALADLSVGVLQGTWNWL